MVIDISYSNLIAEAIEQAKFPHNPQNLYDPIRYILGLSGKRVRPLLVLLGAEVFGYKTAEKAIPAALAIELFHNFSLIHDDIMDHAPLRRGAPTVHQKWDENVAILSGDALLVKAYEEIANCPVDKVAPLLRVFNKVALEVCEGQQLDMDFEAKASVSEAEYIGMIRAKTSVLLGGALQMGAIMADAKAEDQLNIFEFGVNLGIAFQLQDDILDVYGDPENFGKQVGGDILSNKKTILRVKLQQLVNEADARHLTLLSEEKDSTKKIEETKSLYTKYHIKTLADDLKEMYSDMAFSKLAEIKVPAKQKENLLALTKNLMVRTY